MSACRLLEDGEVASLGHLESLEARCECVTTHPDPHPSRTRAMPLRKVSGAARTISKLLFAAGLSGDIILLTYRCSSCKRLVALSLHDLFGLP